MAVGERIIRKDALQKVTGTAKYVEDLIPADARLGDCRNRT